MDKGNERKFEKYIRGRFSNPAVIHKMEDVGKGKM